MAYEVYKRNNARVEAPILSIVPGGRIAVNAAASRILKAAGIKFVLLLWDPSFHRVALKAASKGDKNAFAVSTPANYSGSSLRAKSFLSYVGWHANQRVALPATWNEKEKMLEVALPLEHLGPEKAGNIKRKIAEM